MKTITGRIAALILLLTCMFSCQPQPVFAQAVPAPTISVLPANHVDVIGFYDPNTSPGGSLSGAYSHKIADNTVSISLADVTFSPFVDRSVKGVLTNVTRAHISTTSGLGQRVTTQLGWDILAVGSLGAQTTPGGGTAAGFSGTTGFVGTRPIGTKGATADFAIRVVAGTGPPQYIFGFGFGFGK